VPLDEERAVILRLQQGDRSAVATLYGWYGDLVWRQAILPVLPNRELAEDCLREAFRMVLERIDTWNDQGRSIFFWLRMVARNKAMDVHRRVLRDQKLTEKAIVEAEAGGADVPSPDRGLEIEDTRQMVAASMSRINERYATALRMRLLEDRTREECAEALGVTVGNFDVILHRACKAFRQAWPP
jgi:RNA polymerase sigma-70 factor (ECF subfamily)